MPKDYKNITSKKKTRSGNTGQLKSFFSGLAVGLCVAIIVYFYQHGLGQRTEIVPPEVTIESPEPDLDLPSDTPPPSFDFYEILPNMVVNVSEWEADEDEDIGACSTCQDRGRIRRADVQTRKRGHSGYDP